MDPGRVPVPYPRDLAPVRPRRYGRGVYPKRYRGPADEAEPEGREPADAGRTDREKGRGEVEG